MHTQTHTKKVSTIAYRRTGIHVNPSPPQSNDKQRLAVEFALGKTNRSTVLREGYGVHVYAFHSHHATPGCHYFNGWVKRQGDTINALAYWTTWVEHEVLLGVIVSNPWIRYQPPWIWSMSPDSMEVHYRKVSHQILERCGFSELGSAMVTQGAGSEPLRSHGIQRGGAVFAVGLLWLCPSLGRSIEHFLSLGAI